MKKNLETLCSGGGMSGNNAVDIIHWLDLCPNRLSRPRLLFFFEYFSLNIIHWLNLCPCIFEYCFLKTLFFLILFFEYHKIKKSWISCVPTGCQNQDFFLKNFDVLCCSLNPVVWIHKYHTYICNYSCRLNPYFPCLHMQECRRKHHICVPKMRATECAKNVPENVVTNQSNVVNTIRIYYTRIYLYHLSTCACLSFFLSKRT
jgi:hypothetical protein